METKPTLCFLANFSKTYLFHAIAEELQAKDVNIVWICTNQKIYDFLKEHYKDAEILLINRTMITQDKDAIGEFKLNELLYGDRVFKHEMNNGLRYLTNIQQPIYDFLNQHKVNVCIGEITWAHEILVHRMVQQCEELDCQFLNPHVVRIPNRQFAFFTDERQSELLEIYRTTAPFDGILEIKKPEYLAINDKRLKQANSLMGRLERVKRFITNENIDKLDPTLITNEITRFQSRTKEEWYKETYKAVKRVSFDEVRDESYVFLGLHKQPEASIDVFGRYYEDQFQNIVNLWRVLPQGWKLLVKEHTNAIGDRALDFYTRLQRHPNIVFVEETADSYELIKNAKLAATVTGTIAYEAALLQVPAVTLAPTFFNRINYCKQIRLEDLDSCDDLTEIIDSLKDKYDNREAFSEYLWQNSFTGILTDPISNPAVMEADNVKLLARAFHLAIESVVQSSHLIY